MDALDGWLRGLRTENTRKVYLRYFKKFLEYVGLNPKEALQKRLEDLEGDLLERRWFENKLREYIGVLDEEGTGFELQNQVYGAVKSFFDCYDVSLRLRRQDAPKGTHLKRVRAVSKADIRKVLGVCDLHDKALILFLKDTGLACVDVSRLQIKSLGLGDWKKVLRLENVPVPVKGVRMKTRIPFHTFLGSESVEALHVYFLQREKGTRYLDRLGRGVPPETLTEDSHVFRCKTKLKTMTPLHLSVLVINLSRKAGVKNVTAHSYRRFFQTSLETPDLGLNPLWIRRLMGHKVARDAAGHYSFPTDEQLREAYSRSAPYLNVLSRSLDVERIEALEDRDREQQLEIEQVRADNVMLKQLIKNILDEGRFLMPKKEKKEEK